MHVKDEPDRQHHGPEPEVGDLAGVAYLVDPLPDRQHPTGREHDHSGQQRPVVQFQPIPVRMGQIRRPSAAPDRPVQHHPVGGIGRGVQGLSEQRRRAGQRRRDRLSRHQHKVQAEREEHRERAVTPRRRGQHLGLHHPQHRQIRNRPALPVGQPLQPGANPARQRAHVSPPASGSSRPPRTAPCGPPTTARPPARSPAAPAKSSHPAASRRDSRPQNYATARSRRHSPVHEDHQDQTSAHTRQSSLRLACFLSRSTLICGGGCGRLRRVPDVAEPGDAARLRAVNARLRELVAERARGDVRCLAECGW